MDTNKTSSVDSIYHHYQYPIKLIGNSMDNNDCNKSGKWGAVRAKTNKSKVNELLNKCCKQLYGKM